MTDLVAPTLEPPGDLGEENDDPAARPDPDRPDRREVTDDGHAPGQPEDTEDGHAPAEVRDSDDGHAPAEVRDSDDGHAPGQPEDTEDGHVAGGPDDAADGYDDEETGRSTGALRLVLTVLGLCAVLTAGAVLAAVKLDVGRLLVPDATAATRVGDCLAELPDVREAGQFRPAQARPVDCSTPDAVYDVVGRVERQTEERARDGRQCEPFVTAGQAYYTYSKIPPGGTGYVLCLRTRP